MVKLQGKWTLQIIPGKDLFKMKKNCANKRSMDCTDSGFCVPAEMASAKMLICRSLIPAGKLLAATKACLFEKNKQQGRTRQINFVIMKKPKK